MAADLSAFQQVLEAVQRAQTLGAIALLAEQTGRSVDDPDCYPRGIRLSIERTDPQWKSLRFLSKHLDWLKLDTRTKHLWIRPPEQIRGVAMEVAYLHAVAESLNESGMPCAADIYYR